MYRPCAAAALVISILTLTLRAADWPQFRGPSGNGMTQEKGFPTKWNADQNIRWKTKLPAPGNGSPIVSGDRVFLLCAQDKGKKRSLLCFDRSSGKQLWERTVTYDKEAETHQTNPYCGSTPAADGKRVVAWHNSAGLYCYDFSGKELWSRDLGEFDHIWGHGASPIIHNQRVILNCGPGERIFMTAIGLTDGKVLWETPEPREGKGSKRADGQWMGSWSTPVVASVDGKDQIVCTMPTRVNGYDPLTGHVTWSCDGIRGPKGDLAYSSPMISNGRCVAIGGFSGPGIGFQLGGTGNITAKQRAWRIERNPQSIGTGIFLGDHVYRPNAGPSTIECLDAKTGKAHWNARAGANCWGSMVLADGNLYVTNQDGTTVVFKPNAEKFEMVSRNDLGESSNSTPAFSDGQIFIRTFEHLYCIDDKE